MKWLIAAAVAVVGFFAISSFAPAQRTCACLGAYVDRESAIAIAKRDTPLRQVDSVEGSHGLPFRHMITGRDDAERVIVVWVKTEVSRTAYLDELMPAPRAMALAEAAGLKLGVSPSAALDHMMATGGPIFWRVTNGPQVVHIDAKTGQVIATIGGVVPPGAHH